MNAPRCSYGAKHVYTTTDGINADGEQQEEGINGQVAD